MPAEPRTGFSLTLAHSWLTGGQKVPSIAARQRLLNMLFFNGFSQRCEEVRNAEKLLGHTLTLPV